MKNMHPKNRIEYLRKRRGMVGLEAAIVLIAFVIIAAAFSFMVVNQGLIATQRGKTVIEEGLKQASTPLTTDGSTFVRTTVDGKSVDVIVIPVRAFGVTYVAMWKNETVVSLKIGESAWANIYGGVLYDVSPSLSVTAEDVGLAGGKGTTMSLLHGNVVSDSETITAGGTPLVKSIDYTIDYSLGKITWVTDQTGIAITADYQYKNSETFDPSGPKFDEFVGIKYDTTTRQYTNGTYPSSLTKAIAVLAIQNSNGDESLDSFEKGYLIITLPCADTAKVRDAITVEVRLEKTAPLSIQFNIPEAMPKDTWVLTG